MKGNLPSVSLSQYVLDGWAIGNVAMYHSGGDEYECLDGHGWMTMWQREVGDDGKTIGQSHTVLQRIWYATEMKGTQLSGLLLLDIASSGHIHRVFGHFPTFFSVL
jgi:hypothetical protein